MQGENSSITTVRIYGLERVFRQFLDMEPASILIRGLPGTGKTTLALELINMMHEKYNCFYISTRVSFTKLQRYYPWIIGLINDNSLLSYSNASNAAIDLRLGSASGTMELVLDLITNNKKALIVLDSWDSLVNYAKREERIKMEKTMVTVADTHDALLIFVSEEPEFNTVSYSVDGIVTLSMEQYCNTRIRKMSIDKMRGVAVNNYTYLYTLLNARFTILPTLCDYISLIDKGKDEYHSSSYYGNGNAIVDYKEDMSNNSNRRGEDAYAIIPTWSIDLDNLLGRGFKNGSSVLLEVDPLIDESILLSMLTKMIVRNSINDPSRCIIVSDTPERPLGRLVRYVNGYYNNGDRINDNISNNSSSNNIILLTDKTRLFKSSINANILTFDTDTFFNRYEEIMLKYKRPALMILDHSIIDRYELSKAASIINAIKDDGNVIVIIADTTLNNLSATKSLTDTHMKLLLLENVPLLHVTKPSLGLFGVAYSNNGLSYSLIKVV